ncbi:hypothetical protein WG66_004122 [Moniliophthora roreri]|nr:hypothetical protein WG66_004122 [Moniliophthora roreri]
MSVSITQVLQATLPLKAPSITQVPQPSPCRREHKLESQQVSLLLKTHTIDLASANGMSLAAYGVLYTDECRTRGLWPNSGDFFLGLALLILTMLIVFVSQVYNLKLPVSLSGQE